MSEFLEKLGLEGALKGGFGGEWLANGRTVKCHTPVDGREIGAVTNATGADLETIIDRCSRAFYEWRLVPAPKRGEVVKALGDELRKHKQDLGSLVTLEMGKPLREALGEVQEMIDVCDLAVGLSRQLHGLTMPSERGRHRMMEQWHPLGVVGVITAFNFPVAVWSWNTSLALVCGDTVLWKPSSKTPLTAIACTKIAEGVLRKFGFPPAICSLVVGRGSEVGDIINKDKRVALISYTGSVSGGRHVGSLIQERFGKMILELGGNNAVIVSDKGDLRLALDIVFFGAIGTAGQRCTSTRRVLIQEKVYDRFVSGLTDRYKKMTIGDPFETGTIMGPLVDVDAVDTMMAALDTIKKQGGRVLIGGERLPREGGCYVTPCIVEAKPDLPLAKEETFAPVLYVMKYKTIEEAIHMQNDVPQGLSSSIITNDLIESELFLGPEGSDCGIASVNVGTNGAEIGGAFGGEKETGGGRESGSDAWKAYMRRQTNTINFSGAVELAQGIKFFEG